MGMKRAVSMVAALALAAAPTVAQAAASSLSLAPAARAAADLDESGELAGGVSIWIGLALVAAVVVIALTGDDDTVLDDVPTSP